MIYFLEIPWKGYQFEDLADNVLDVVRVVHPD